MHILALPKWYPGHNDPQLGDFIRKQMLAAASKAQVSVVFTAPVGSLGSATRQELDQRDGAWELRCYYRPSTISFSPLRKVINLKRWWSTTRAGIERCFREQGKPDIVHVHILVRPALMALHLKRRYNLPFILSEQSSEYLDGTWAAKGPLFKWANRYLFRQAAAITAVSAHLAEGMKRLGLCTDPDVVPNTVPGTDRPLPPAGPKERFMVVADLVDRTKNVSGVLRALKMARDEGSNANLDIIGDGRDGAELRALATALGSNGHVTWHGRLSNAEVLERMSGAGAVIINSHVETFSVVTGEALALGKPVIATRCGGPEGFITPVNGVLIPPGDDRALARMILSFSRGEFHADPAIIRQSVSDRFSAPVVADRFMAVYERVLHR